MFTIFTEEEERVMRTLCEACGNERASDRLAREVVLYPALLNAPPDADVPD